MKKRFFCTMALLLTLMFAAVFPAAGEMNVLLVYDAAKDTLSIRCTGLHAVQDYSVIVLRSGTALNVDNVVLIDQLTTTDSGRLDISFVQTDMQGCTVLLGGAFDGEQSPYNAGTVEAREYASMIMPAALNVIEEEAFVGSAVNYVYIGEEVHTIGARAFQNCTELLGVTIPASVQAIGEDAFSGCPNAVIICEENSAAHQYAAANGIEFELQ